MAGQIWQQVVWHVPIAALVAFEHQAHALNHAHVFRHARKVGHAPLFRYVREQQERAARLKPGDQHIRLRRAQIAFRRVEEQAIRILGNRVYREQMQIMHRVVFALQLLQERLAQFPLPVARERIHGGQVFAGHIVNCAGDLVFAIEAGAGRVAIPIGVHLVFGNVNLSIVHQPRALPGFHEHAIGVNLRKFPLAEKARIACGIDGFHGHMAGERRVIFQQLQNRAVFPALVGQQIQRNLFRQIAHELAALVGKRIERLFGHIDLREAGRQRAYDGVGRSTAMATTTAVAKAL